MRLNQGQEFALGALTGILLVAIVWMTVSSMTANPVPAGRPGRSGLLGQSTGTSGQPAGPRPAQRCARETQALALPLEAAAPTLHQWRVHVGAMNRLVAGAITLDQAKAFWSRSRVGAKQNIATFHRADRLPRPPDATCPTRSRPGMSPALRSCVRQVRADDAVLAAARTAVHTWEMHVHNMELLRSGQLSPTVATTMWLSMWRQGIRELHAYHVAARYARHAGGCQP